MTGIVEHVARATNHAESEPHKTETGYGDIYGWDDVMPAVRERHLLIARAAIRATLEHARDNISRNMYRAASDALVPPGDAAACFVAMTEALLEELDGTESEAR